MAPLDVEDQMTDNVALEEETRSIKDRVKEFMLCLIYSTILVCLPLVIYPDGVYTKRPLYVEHPNGSGEILFDINIMNPRVDETFPGKLLVGMPDTYTLFSSPLFLTNNQPHCARILHFRIGSHLSVCIAMLCHVLLCLY